MNTHLVSSRHLERTTTSDGLFVRAEVARPRFLHSHKTDDMNTIKIDLNDLLPEIYDELLSKIPRQYWPLIQVYLRDLRKPKSITVRVPSDIIDKLSAGP